MNAKYKLWELIWLLIIFSKTIWILADSTACKKEYTLHRNSLQLKLLVKRHWVCTWEQLRLQSKREKQRQGLLDFCRRHSYVAARTVRISTKRWTESIRERWSKKLVLCPLRSQYNKCTKPSLIPLLLFSPHFLYKECYLIHSQCCGFLQDF